MCGICGIFDPGGNKQIDEQIINSMADAMVHRGPDDHGSYLNSAQGIGLGFRRLSIIDLSRAGHQPMSNEDGTVWVVFNGEIYNHRELRQELEAKGHKYVSKADSESLIHGYEEWGGDVVKRLRGMFAFAVWDEKKRALFMARDRIGIKPLYYTYSPGQFVFASEIKAILRLPWVERRVNREALELYLSFAASPAPMTLFDGIFKLQAGHRLWIDSQGNLKNDQYWDAVFSGQESAKKTESFYVDRIRELFMESIQLRMMSDVPFGVFLSGGIDSSLNVALMSKVTDEPVNTFSVAIRGDEASNEMLYARQVAKHFQTNHHEIEIGSEDFIRFLPRMAYFQDEPLADPVCIPLYYVAELARNNGVTVVQVGEGSDELFCGYRSYARYLKLYPFWRKYMTWPETARRSLAWFGEKTIRHPSWVTYLQKAAINEPLFCGGAHGFTESWKQVLLGSDGTRGRAGEWVSQCYEARKVAGGRGSFLDDMIYLELQNRLPELLLMRVDKMTMATSIEARVPFLDHEFVRFALSIPAEYKYRDGQLKYILKKAARGIVPDFVIDRRKTGFCGSASNMVNDTIVCAAENLVRSNHELEGLLNWGPFFELCRAARNGSQEYGLQIWILLNLALWYSVWIQQVPLDELGTWLAGPRKGREISG